MKGGGLDTARVASTGNILDIFRVLQVSAFGLDNIKQHLAGLQNLHVGLKKVMQHIFLFFVLCNFVFQLKKILNIATYLLSITNNFIVLCPVS